MSDNQLLAFVIGRMRGGDEKLTYGDLLHPAMKVKTKKGADLFKREYSRYLIEIFHKTPEKAESIVRSNVGYFSGYCDQKTMDRVRKLYGFGHPIFG
jgi:hypothetical protein